MDEKGFITDVEKLIDDYAHVIEISKKDYDYNVKTILPYYYNKIDSIRNIAERLNSFGFISNETYLTIINYINEKIDNSDSDERK